MQWGERYKLGVLPEERGLCLAFYINEVLKTWKCPGGLYFSAHLNE